MATSPFLRNRPEMTEPLNVNGLLMVAVPEVTTSNSMRGSTARPRARVTVLLFSAVGVNRPPSP